MNRKLSNEELNRPSIEEYRATEKFPIVVVLEDIRSLANVGSVFRTGDAFNIEEVILVGITGQPPHRDIQRTALGATESVKWSYSSSIGSVLERLNQRGYQIFAVEQSEGALMLGTKLFKDNPVALVLGNEVSGVKQSTIDLCHGVIEIPQSGVKHSLNVSVAAGVILWEIYKAFGTQP